MNLSVYSLPGWDGRSYNLVGLVEEMIIIELILEKPYYDPIESGRPNLLAIDNQTKAILWIAEIPEMNKSWGCFNQSRIEENEIITFYGGSVYCRISLINGKLLEERFVK